MLKIRLGIVGAMDAIEIIQDMLKKYSSELDTVFFSCLTEKDLIDKVLPVKEDIDMWLCTGPITYNMVQKWGEITSPTFFVPYYGSCLYKTVLKAVYEQKVSIEQISFDAGTRSDYARALEEAEIKDKVCFVESEMVDIDSLIQYHLDLWKRGQIKVVITGHPIQDELQKHGLPTYRVFPSTRAVDSIVHHIFQTHELMVFKGSQIAVQMIEIHSFASMTKNTYSSNELHKIEMMYSARLLSYSKKIHGSLQNIGFGRYAIFTTRGPLQELTSDFRSIPKLDDIDFLEKNAITCGIGVGKTVYEAEIHAGTAFLHAKEYGEGTWMVCLDNKTIAGPLDNTEYHLHYSYQSDRLEEVSHVTSLSVMTLQKLKSILRKRANDQITSHELAQYMQITQRSARRILMELEKYNFAEVIAEEKPYTRGRPRKIYKVFV
ncbi:hypothetical protein [Shimazuella kribbensis]|uniref:hypothetical protein n=1 Tax=Shimazuella kribbensis TaxID=139808 RepID=UPI00040895A8|nr:hypothetical protein [Shimazuella kribbensis]